MVLGRDMGLTRISDIAEKDVDDATEFLSPKTKHLYRWWASAAEGRMPPRKLFDIVDHKLVVANLFVTDVLANGDFRFRLFGEDVIRIIGRNRTGETVGRGDQGEYGHELYDYYQAIIQKRVCRKCNGTLTFAIGGAKRFESIDCPLADDSAERVATIIGVMDVVK